MNRPVVEGYVEVIMWNAQANRDHDAVARGLDALLAQRPHLLDVSEAGEYRGVIGAAATEHGYRRIQLERTVPKRFKNGRRLLEEDSNIAALARLDVGVGVVTAWRMRRTWTGPVNGWPHMPRVYLRMPITVPGVPGWWRFSLAHWPTGKPASNAAAVRETERRVANWFRLSRLPAVHMGDLNQSVRALRDRFPRLRVVPGHGPDIALTNGRVVAEVDVLPKYGADHNAVRMRFRRAS